MTAKAPTIYAVVRHFPGPNWASGVSFREQPGVGQHVGYMSMLMERGLLVLGGPFLDDSGGMLILRCDNVADAEIIANEDPTVQNGLLCAEVRAWMVPMSTVG